jgi:hypothetical protein
VTSIQPTVCKSEKFPAVAKAFLFSKMYRLAMGTVANVVKRLGVTMATLGSKVRITGVKPRPHVPSFFLQVQHSSLIHYSAVPSLLVHIFSVLFLNNLKLRRIIYHVNIKFSGKIRRVGW